MPNFDMGGLPVNVDDRAAPAGPSACIACHAAQPDLFEHPNAELCPECRERFIRFPFPKWLLAVLAAIVAVSAACYALSSQSLADFIELARADRYFGERHYILAERAYESLAGKYPGSDDIRVKTLGAAMASGDFSCAAMILNDNYVGKNLPDDLYKKLNGYAETLEKYGRAYDKVEAALTGIEDEGAMLTRLHSLLDSSDTDPVVMLQMAALNESLGNHGEALRLMNEAISAGDRYLPAYSALAGILRRSGDLEGAEAACEKALEINLDDVEAHRQLAVVHMLRQEWDAAVKEAETAYALDRSGTYVREALATACHMAGDSARRDAVLAEMRQFGEDTGNVEDFLAGRITLEDIYMN
jgi:tetratricopeptide (TPR) repeat protein